MADIGIVGLILITANIAFSYKGFTSSHFFEKYEFNVDRILIGKEFKRLITSSFLHADWTHLILNMVSLYFFNGLLEGYLGGFYFCLIYFASAIGGDLLALLIHRNHGDYSAIGASGAVCGIIFSSIALFPELGLRSFGMPFSIPSWLYGVLYVAYSIYGIKSQKDNIGHEAHLGGALVGMGVALLIRPIALTANYIEILLITLPALTFIYLIITRPRILFIDNYFFKTHKPNYTIEHKYNETKINNQNDLDKLLDKINRNGIDSLSKKEKQKLEEYSKHGF